MTLMMNGAGSFLNVRLKLLSTFPCYNKTLRSLVKRQSPITQRASSPHFMDFGSSPLSNSVSSLHSRSPNPSPRIMKISESLQNLRLVLKIDSYDISKSLGTQMTLGFKNLLARTRF